MTTRPIADAPRSLTIPTVVSEDGQRYFEPSSTPLEPRLATVPDRNARHERATPKHRWAAAMRADPPGTYPRLTGQPAPGKKQPRMAWLRQDAHLHGRHMLW